jgi:hypothetical protein
MDNPLLISTPVCDHHQARVRATLHAMPRTYTELHQAMAPTSGGTSGERVSTGETIRLPINTDARALQQDMIHLALEAEARIRHHRGWMPAPMRGREGPTLQGAVTVILDHHDQLLRLDGAEQLCVDVIDIRRRADRLLGATTPPKRRPTPGPKSGWFGHRRPPGDDLATCHACGHDLDLEQYHHHTRTVAEGLAA